MKTEQKNSAVDLTELALGIVVLGIVVSIGAVILSNIGANQITNAETYRVVNETVTPSALGDTLAVGWFKEVNFIINKTGNQVINSGNWTASVNGAGTGTVTNTTGRFPGDWQVTYTVYNKSDPRFELTDKAGLSLAEYSDWFSIIVIVGIASMIIALIFMAFGKNKNGNQVSY
jgi:hypothetical protein